MFARLSSSLSIVPVLCQRILLCVFIRDTCLHRVTYWLSQTHVCKVVKFPWCSFCPVKVFFFVLFKGHLSPWSLTHDLIIILGSNIAPTHIFLYASVIVGYVLDTDLALTLNCLWYIETVIFILICALSRFLIICPLDLLAHLLTLLKKEELLLKCWKIPTLSGF